MLSPGCHGSTCLRHCGTNRPIWLERLFFFNVCYWSLVTLFGHNNCKISLLGKRSFGFWQLLGIVYTIYWSCFGFSFLPYWIVVDGYIPYNIGTIYTVACYFGKITQWTTLVYKCISLLLLLNHSLANLSIDSKLLSFFINICLEIIIKITAHCSNLTPTMT